MPPAEGKTRRGVAALKPRCSACGRSVARGHKYCPRCGAAVLPATSATAGSGPSLQVPGRAVEDLAEERRQVTVLFADLSGSTTLGERLDPEELRLVLASFFSALSRQLQAFGATIDKYIGDAVMAVFGAPVAHEDDAERSIRAALAMQKAIAQLNDDLERQHGVRLALRIGINTGEVVAGLLAGEVQSAYTVVGDTVNLAQRLEAAAPAGEVLIGPVTYRVVKNDFEIETLPPVTVKGKSAPVRVYRIIRAYDEDRAVPELAVLVGRDQELAVLHDALTEIATAGGRAACISGEPGVGKSRLVKEFSTRLPPGHDLVIARCGSFETDTPYRLVARLIRNALGLGTRADEAAARAALADGTVSDRPLDDASVRLMLEVLGYGQGSTLDPQTKHRVVVELLRRLFARRAERGPLVIILEDLHWVDPVSAAVLAQVAPQLMDLRCLLVVTSRPEWEPAWPAARIALQPLGHEESHALVSGLLGGPVDPVLGDALLARTGGNPFFAEEIVTSLKESGAVVERDGTWTILGELEEKVPETVQELLIARLDRLDVRARRTLQAAAVVGRTFEHQVLARVASTPTLLADLRSLEQKGFIEIRSVRRARIYLFRHALIQEVAYSTQLQAQRRKLHGRVGHAMEELHADRTDEVVNELAFHYRRSDDDAKAVHWLCRAGDRAKALFANQEALASYRAALERLGDRDLPVGAAGILERIGDVQTVVGKYDDALVSFRAARERDGLGPAGVARLQRKLGTALARKGAYSDALAALAEGMTALGDELDVEVARLGVRIGEVQSRSGNYAAAREMLTKAIDVARQLGADDILAEGLKYLGAVLNYLGDLPGALRLYERCLAIYDRGGDIAGTAAVRNGIGMLHYRAARWDDALREFTTALSLEERVGDPWAAAMCENNIGEVHLYRGDFAAAIAALQWALDRFTAIGSESEAALALMGLGNARVRSGDVVRGRSDLVDARRRMLALGKTRYLPAVYRHLAYADLLGGDLEGATASAERSLEYARAENALSQQAMTECVLGEIALARGDKPAARAMLNASRDRLADLGELAEVERTDAVLATLDG